MAHIMIACLNQKNCIRHVYALLKILQFQPLKPKEETSSLKISLLNEYLL